MENSLKEYINGCLAIIDSIKKVGAEELITNNLVKKDWDINKYRDIIAYLYQEKKIEYLIFFSNESLRNGLIEQIKSIISQRRYTINDYAALCSLFELNGDVNIYSNIAELIMGRVSELNVSDQEMKPVLLSIFHLYLKHSPPIENILLNFIRAGRNAYYFQKSVDLNDFDSMAVCMLFKLLYHREPVDLSLIHNSEFRRIADRGIRNFNNILSQDFYKNESLWRSMIAIMKQYPELYNNLFSSLSNADKNLTEVKVFNDIIKQHFVLDKGDALRAFSPFLLSHNYFIREILGAENEEIFNEFITVNVRQEGLINYIQTAGYDKDNTNHRSFADIIFVLNLDTNEFSNWVFESLQTLDKNGWLKVMKADAFTANIVEYLSSKYNKKFDMSMREALEAIAQETIKSEQKLPYDKSIIAKYISSLNEDNYILFTSNLRDIVIENPDKNSSVFLDYFGDLLIDCSIWKNREEDFFRKYLFNVIENSADMELKWCTELIEACKFYKIRQKNTRIAIKGVLGKLENKLKEVDLDQRIKIHLERLLHLLQKRRNL